MNYKVRLGINGLGRIGRQIFRLAIKDPDIDLEFKLLAEFQIGYLQLD